MSQTRLVRVIAQSIVFHTDSPYVFVSRNKVYSENQSGYTFLNACNVCIRYSVKPIKWFFTFNGGLAFRF